MIIQIAKSSIMEIVAADDSLVNNATMNRDSSQWSFEKRPGMLYVVVRAVSVGTNGNGDHFTYDELKRAWPTFVGKGVFVNHQSSDIEKKRGKIVDAKFIEDRGSQNAYVATVLEVNAEAYPDLARMIKAGMVDSVSMGCQVAYSNCSICQHAAKTVKDYCFHVRMHKGGAYDGRPVYEENHGVEFIEVSFVTTGADAQAKVLEIIAKQARITNSDVRQLWAAASLDSSLVSQLMESQKNLETIIAAELDGASNKMTIPEVKIEETEPKSEGVFKTDDGIVKDVPTPSDKIESPEHIIMIKIQNLIQEAATLRAAGVDNSMVLAELDSWNRYYKEAKVASLQRELDSLLSLAEEELGEGIDCTATLAKAERIAKALHNGRKR